ncbi:unnamed protein product, partial [Prorocentrum cordatum]
MRMTAREICLLGRYFGLGGAELCNAASNSTPLDWGCVSASRSLLAWPVVRTARARASRATIEKHADAATRGARRQTTLPAELLPRGRRAALRVSPSQGACGVRPVRWQSLGPPLAEVRSR